MAKKILIVDDEPQFLLLVETRLRAAGYEVITASDGAEGLTKAEKESPDLILLDVMMPNMSGVETLRELKGKDDTRTIPVIMLTAKGATETILETQELGAADYFIKPFESDEFLENIQKYV